MNSSHQHQSQSSSKTNGYATMNITLSALNPVFKWTSTASVVLRLTETTWTKRLPTYWIKMKSGQVSFPHTNGMQRGRKVSSIQSQRHTTLTSVLNLLQKAIKLSQSMTRLLLKHGNST